MKPISFSSSMRMNAVKQCGLSLVELLISMLIGLIVLAAGSAVYISSVRSARVSEYSTYLNEDGVLAMNFLQTQIRQAGYFQRLYGNEAPLEGAAVRGCSGDFVNPKAAGYKAVACKATGQDSILVRYEADTSNTFPTATNAPTNCHGDAISAALIPADTAAGTPARFQADNRFYVNSNDGMLYCAGSTGAAVDAKPLFANVKQMVLRYGVAEQASREQEGVFDAAKHQVVAYLSAKDIDALGGTVDANWGRVLSVKICLLMKSDSPVKDAVGNSTYTDCHGATVNNNDSYLHRAFVSTVMLRNRLVVPEQKAP